jgi:hypothetical protein
MTNRPLRRSVLALVAILALAACQSPEDGLRLPGGVYVPADLGISELMPLPRPFQSKNKDLPLLQTVDGESDIVVMPIAGLPAHDNEALAQAIAGDAQAYDLLVLTPPVARPTHVLKGRLHIATSAVGRATLNWALLNPDKSLAGSFEVPLDAATASGEPLSDAALRRIARATAAGINRITQGSLGGVAPIRPGTQPSVQASGPPRIYVGKVTGAPGDGNKALPSALAATLASAGAKIVADPAQAEFSIHATVELTPADGGTETVAIAWTVDDAKGASLGTINQSNRIAQGALAGPWRETAYDIALGAESGLARLIAAADAKASGAPPIAGAHKPPVVPESVRRSLD